MKKFMTKKISKAKGKKEIKVWAVFDGDDKLVGAHHTKKYIAEMNAIFVDEGRVVQATMIYSAPKKKKAK